MKNITLQLEQWLDTQNTLTEEASEQENSLLRNYHAGQAFMAKKVLDVFPAQWVVYQLERTRVRNNKKQTESLGLYGSLDDAKCKLNRYRTQREQKGYTLDCVSDDGCEVELHRSLGQGEDIDVTLTIITLPIL